MTLKERVLEAALIEFDERGINFTMDDLAARLSVSKRTLYEQIGKKEDIVGLFIDEAFKNIKLQEAEIMGNEGMTPLERLKKGLIVLPNLKGVLDYRRIYEIQRYYPAQYQRLEAYVESDWDRTFELMTLCVEEKWIRPIRFSIFKEMFTATIDHMLKDRFLIQNGLTYEQALAEMVDIFFEGLVYRNEGK